jgi:hypothetical protein
MELRSYKGQLQAIRIEIGLGDRLFLSKTSRTKLVRPATVTAAGSFCFYTPVFALRASRCIGAAGFTHINTSQGCQCDEWDAGDRKVGD